MITNFKQSLKEVLFKIQSWHIVLAGLFLIFLAVFLAIQFVVDVFPPAFSKYYLLALLCFLLFVNRIFIVSKYGIRVAFFVLLSVTLAIGFWAGVLLIAVSSILVIFSETRTTRVDSWINKDVSTTLKRTLDYLILVVLIFAFSIVYTSPAQNIAKSAVWIFAVWSILLFAKMLVLGRNIFHWQSATVVVEFLINYWLVVNFGKSFVEYLSGL